MNPIEPDPLNPMTPGQPADPNQKPPPPQPASSEGGAADVGDAVPAVAYHPQGKLVACGTHGEVRLLDPATGEPAGTLGGQTGRVTALAFAPDGSWLAAASGEPGKTGVIRVYAADKQGRPMPAAAA